MNELTADQLDQIEARANAATPGPWDYVMTWALAGVKSGIEMRNDGGEWVDATASDRAFMAAARTDVPALVAALREARAQVEAWVTYRCSQIDQEATNAIDYSLRVRERDAALAEVQRLQQQLVAESQCPQCGEVRECIGCEHRW